MNTPNYRKFRTNENIQFFQDIFTTCKKNNPAELKIESKADKLNQMNINLAKVLIKDKGSEITEKIVYYDHL